MFDEYNDDEIKSILTAYKRKKIKSKERYESIKYDENFKEKTRERSKKYYQDNKHIIHLKYQQNKKTIQAKSSYNYYKRTGREHMFEFLHPEKYADLVVSGYINLLNPSESV
tara:strand:+ start:5849 stop:6184 length:336 start_codon:yes stop_codon:yes gene_type:complete